MRIELAFATVLLSIAPISAQVNATGTVAGQVTDPSGKAVPNAQVRLVDQQTGIEVTKRTGSAGRYAVFPLVKPGIYSIKVNASGFADATRPDLVLEIDQTVQQDLTMQISGASTQIVVSGAAPLLDTETTEVGNVIMQHTVQQLPLNGRNFSQLALLVPGTNPGPVGGIRTQGGGNETARAGAEVIADGARGSFNLFLIDGLDDRDQSVGTLKIFPTLEGIEEFKVQAANYDAGFASGGTVLT